MIKEKKCRGNGVAIGHGCGKMVPVSLYDKPNRKYGLGISCGCYPKWLYNTPEGLEKLSNATLKATQPRKELEKAEREQKERKRLPAVLKATQDAFNAYIRERDKYKPCISKNTPWNPDHEAGHLFTVKQYTALRFDEDNVHGQSLGENRFNEGNFEDYMVNLKYRIGEKRVNELIEKARYWKSHTKKWTIAELDEIRKKYQRKLRELKSQAA